MNKWMIWGAIAVGAYWLGSRRALEPALAGVRQTIAGAVMSLPETEPDRAELGP